MASVMFGTAAVAATETTAATAATAGLFGAGGQFALGQTLLTTGALAGGVGTLASGMQQAEMADAQADYAEGMGRYNAALVEQQADHDKRVAAEGFRREQARRRVAMGKSGVSGGSAVEVLAGAAASAALDREMISYNAKLKARTARYGGNADAGFYRSSARASRTAAPMEAGGSLLAGGARIFRGGR